jgi:serine phosphatase RsbU (regulator of sigma subunit)
MIKYNKIIEQKNKNITSSIQYAKKIQEAIFVPYGNLSAYFPDSCIFFKPRDIVSGDFYWNAQVDDKILVAAVDCTGHGVPGAFMSLIGNILLKDIVIVQKITKPDIILNELNKQVRIALKPTDEQESTNDGMDMALVSINTKEKSLEFAGAKRPLLYITNDELCELKGDRMPIGGKEVYGKDKVFTCHSLKLNENDLVVLFSDGLIDQFGGEKNRKFLISRFKEFIIEHKNTPLNQSMDNLDKVYLEWKGDYDQVDDILVIGLRL